MNKKEYIIATVIGVTLGAIVAYGVLYLWVIAISR